MRVRLRYDRLVSIELEADLSGREVAILEECYCSNPHIAPQPLGLKVIDKAQAQAESLNTLWVDWLDAVQYMSIERYE